MEPLMYNDYRQQPITSDEACAHYRAYLARLEALIVDQEDTVQRVRTLRNATQLASARTSLWRLLTKRQGVLDTLSAYERGKGAQQSA